MEIETIYGDVIGKANHYKAVPGNDGTRRIIKDEAIRTYERSFLSQCSTYKERRINRRFGLVASVQAVSTSTTH